MANDKEMHPLSGDRVETNGVYQDDTGHETPLKAGQEFPMDPQLGRVEFELVALALDDNRDHPLSDEEAAVQAHVPVSASNEDEARARKTRQLKHRQHGGER